MTTNERIKLLRTKANMTQEELGDLLGVQKAAIQKYESGSIINFKRETIEKLGTIFNVTPSYILGWDKFDHEIDIEALKVDLHKIELVQKYFGEIGVELYELLSTLNNDGIEKIIEYCEDINQNPKYLK